jgi:hypothetical protein
MIFDDQLGKPVIWHPQNNELANRTLLRNEKSIEVPHAFPMLTGNAPPEIEALNALYHMTLITATVIEETGGVPDPTFFLFNNDQGIHAAQETKITRPYAQWTNLSRIILSRIILNIAANDNTNVILHVTTTDNITTVRNGIQTTRPHLRITAWHTTTEEAWTFYAPLYNRNNRTSIHRDNQSNWEEHFNRVDTALQNATGQEIMKIIHDFLTPNTHHSRKPDENPELIQPTNAFTLWMMPKIEINSINDTTETINDIIKDMNLTDDLKPFVTRIIQAIKHIKTHLRT